MRFIHKIPSRPKRLGILPGSFNPVTVAHLALAQAALGCCEEVLFVLPRVFPHKEYTGATLEQRLELMEAALAAEGRFSLGVADAGLFVEIATECREVYGPGVRLSFLCGRDAAERIAGWDYGSPVEFSSLLQEFDLLVADRDGSYTPPPELSAFIQGLDVADPLDGISATEVRDRLARGLPWEHLVPAAIHRRVGEIYGRNGATAPD